MTKARCSVIDVRVGNRVRRTRQFRDHGVDDVAFFLDVSPAEYVALEEGRKRFSAVKLLLLSEFLAVNVAMFFGEGDKFDAENDPILNPMTGNVVKFSF